MRRRLRSPLLGVAVIVGGLLASSCQPTPPPPGPADVGRWTVLPTTGTIVQTHAAVLRTGKVLFMAGSELSPEKFAAGDLRVEEWDPRTNAVRSVPPPWDLWCAGHTFLPDGKLLIAGGTGDYPNADGYYVGSPEA